MSDETLKVGDTIEVTTEGIAYGGDAVARHEGAVIFIPYAAADERLVIQITEQKKNFFRGSIIRVLEPSDARRDPPCEYFGRCGGCQLQHLDYAAQLSAKEGFIRDALERIGRIEWQPQIKVQPSPELGYRTRARLTLEKVAQVGDASNQASISIGFNEARSKSICDVSFCPVLSDGLNKALSDLREKLGGTWPFTGRAHEIEAAAGDSGYAIQPPIPGLSSGKLNCNVGDATYVFEPSIFFQSNRELLRDLVEAVIADQKGGLAIDLYSGVGLFSIALARRFERVVAVESESSAVKAAIENIAINRIENVRVIKASVEEWVKNFVRRLKERTAEAPGLIVLDPPRKGASAAIKDVARMKSAKIVYVSCDPTTLARDLRTLVDCGYVLDDIGAFDLFPQTYHVETVVKLSRAAEQGSHSPSRREKVNGTKTGRTGA
ncbi:MAG: hypothetical protein DMF61_02735 [Blastocatellia bacterium AA13]|nr:MAG: hypothetical protein DMF61_02735 [Blastocatellia bacterium AA13]